MSNRLAIFDCDGTLVDSQGNICIAMEQAFAAAKLAAPSREATRRVVGLSLVEAMQQLHPDADDAFHAELAEHYRAAFFAMRQEGTVYEPLYEGIVEAIEAIDAAGWLLGVATGKSDRGLNAVLDGHGILPRFVALHTADRHPSKPHPSMIDACIADVGASPETTVMIGDTSYDMAMAKAAGVVAIGVAWGYHPPEELRAAGADMVLGHAGEITDVLKELSWS